MPCDTRVLVQVDDNEINREARKKLGLPLTGGLSASDAGRVKVEAGIIKTRRLLLRMAPDAVVTRDGDTLKVSVEM